MPAVFLPLLWYGSLTATLAGVFFGIKEGVETGSQKLFFWTALGGAFWMLYQMGRPRRRR